MTKILAIGNSFSQDATRWLHQIAQAGGKDTKIINLYIGGCSLETHWHNAEQNLPHYQYELNGEPTARMVSIHEALIEERWDIVTLQQVSGLSGIWESYNPYLQKLSAYAKLYAPSARQWIHQTWAYEIDSTHGNFPLYHSDQEEMYQALTAAYEKAAQQLGVSIIPTGRAIQTLRKNPPFDYAQGGLSLCRDGFHLDYVYGRYVAGAVWYKTLLGGNISSNPFIPFSPEGEEADPEILQVIINTIDKI